MDPIGVLDTALDQVTRLQENVIQAVVPEAGMATLQHLGDAQQNISRLQQLSAQLQQLAAAVQKATPPVSQPDPNRPAAWAKGVQDSAQQAAAALQDELTAALSSPSCNQLWPNPSAQHAGPYTLWHMLHRLRAATPQLEVHLFRAAADKQLCSSDSSSRGPYDPNKGRHATMHADSVAHISAYVSEVRVVVPGVFAAAIALSSPGSLQPLRVCVDSADRASLLDPWTHSRHQVFKRISMLAGRALLHFQNLQAAHELLTPPPADHSQGNSSSSSSSSSGECVALEALLLWLASYDDLFSRPCSVSGKVVMWAQGSAAPMPPYVRPYWLSFSGLKEAASSRAARKAYHAHLAPWPRQEPPTAAAAAAAAAAAYADADGTGVASSVPNGSVVHAPVGAGLRGAAGRGGAVLSEVAVGQLMPWDTAEFTDDEVRAQLRQVIGDIF